MERKSPIYVSLDLLNERILQSKEDKNDLLLFVEKVSEIVEIKDNNLLEISRRMEDQLDRWTKEYEELKNDYEGYERNEKKLTYMEGLIDGMKQVLLPLQKYQENDETVDV